jgi:hypothetical protein
MFRNSAIAFMLQDAVAVLDVGTVNHVTINFQTVDSEYYTRSGDYVLKRGNVRRNVILKRFHVTIFAVQSNKYYIF